MADDKPLEMPEGKEPEVVTELKKRTLDAGLLLFSVGMREQNAWQASITLNVEDRYETKLKITLTVENEGLQEAQP